MDYFTQVNAYGKLQKAKTAFERCKQAGDLNFENEWEVFIVAINSIFNYLEKATKGHPKLEPWFGKKKNERRKDPLLNYLHKARNSDQHETGSLLRTHVQTFFKSATGGQIFVRKSTAPDGSPDIQVWSEDGSPVIVERIGPEFVLAKITDTTHKDEFLPPKKHLGEEISDNRPLVVGQLALNYYEKLITETCQMARRHQA